MKKPPRLRIDIPPMGLPGEVGSIASMFRSSVNPNHPVNIGGPAGLPGKYRVRFVFSRPGYAIEPERQVSIGSLTGDSHLAITKPAYSPPDPNADQIQIDATTPDGKFRLIGHPNQNGFLSHIETEEFDAQNFDDAQQKAFRSLCPALSDWSIHLEIPLAIWRIETTETRTGGVHARFSEPFIEMPWAINPQSSPEPEFRFYAAIYREALNSSSPIYRFLCLFKIMEAIRSRRNRLANEARTKGHAFTRPVEKLPDMRSDFGSWLSAAFPFSRMWDDLALDSVCLPEVVGKKFNRVIDDYLTPLRNDIAHIIIESGEITLSTDDLLHAQKISHWLPVTRCIVRHMLRNEFPAAF
ncbi:MAG: methylamine utilization protein MauJ [Terriglobia bacterium]